MPADKSEPVLYRGKYCREYYVNGERKRRSLGTADLSVARKRLALHEEISKRHAVAGQWDVARIWNAYQADLEGRPGGEALKYSGRAVLPFFGHLIPEQIDKALCQEYTEQRRALGRSDGSIWSELNRLRSSLRWAVKCKFIASAPYIWRPRKPVRRHDYLEKDEAHRLLASLHAHHLKIFVLLALMTAGRAAAILELTWDRVDFDRGEIALENPDRRHTEGKGRASVPMNSTIRAALLTARRGATTRYVVDWQGHPVRRVGQSLAKAAKRAGLKHVHPHMLRHTAAVWMAVARVPMAEIAQYLGHGDSRITESIYARFAPGHLVSAAEALELGIYEIGSGPNEPKSRASQA